MTIKSLEEASTYAEVLSWASSFLEENSKDPHIAEWLLKERFDYSLTDLVRLQRQKMNQPDKDRYVADIKEAASGKPPQHIVGHEWFYDRKFYVSEDTLIPRPETEEWFHGYIEKLPDRPLRVLDIGTGSGVLAISHKLERPQDDVVAVDISEAALAVAQKNASKLGAEVTFHKSDIMKSTDGTFDLIVSNPPYISQTEREVMDESVIGFEPHIALFAEDEGLYFYRKIAEQALQKLNPGGQLVLEFGYKQGDEIFKIFQDQFSGAIIEIEKDFSGHDRVLHLKCETKNKKEET